ncbi:2OG-Fe(II) oxygenase family protein [Kitasatospora sp. NPDC048540]|uniref:2OG-Fe(II) oxygenase family protein n=1 Tax=unclassified Kitasatospora TaxID=2633591 RepID=UPI00053A2F08|nr:2OG-Fe(II) oxygenase family protein [Kitasatospora sp. MBT63]
MTPISPAAAVDRHHFPYSWARVEDLLEPAHAELLAAEFPTAALRESRSPHGHYLLRDCTVVESGEPTDAVAGLSGAWRRLLDWMLSADYRAFVTDATGADLAGCALKVRLCEYGPGTFMTAHTDRADRVATQILYLSPAWDESWGGGLDVLTSADDDDPAAVAASLWPRFNTSVLFARSEHSFHAVRQVSPTAPLPRRTVLAQFVTVRA